MCPYFADNIVLTIQNVLRIHFIHVNIWNVILNLTGHRAIETEFHLWTA